MSDANDVTYAHTSPGWVMIGLMVAVFAVALGVLLAMASGDEEMAQGMNVVLATMGIVFVILLVLFRNLRVQVRGDAKLHVIFPMGWPHLTYPISEIEAAEPYSSPWYYGYGIRLTPSGWMYNVSGPRAVKLTLTNNRHRIIGTTDQQGLIDAINNARRTSPESASASAESPTTDRRTDSATDG